MRVNYRRAGQRCQLSLTPAFAGISVAFGNVGHAHINIHTVLNLHSGGN